MPETKFGYGEYSDYPEAEEREHAREDLAVWDHNPSQNIKSSRLSQIVTEEPIDVSDALDPSESNRIFLKLMILRRYERSQ